MIKSDLKFRVSVNLKSERGNVIKNEKSLVNKKKGGEKTWVITMIVGRHIIAELYGVSKELISNEATVRQILEEVTEKAELEKVGSVYKQFNPHGVTGIVLIAESHVSIHTWPEFGLVNLDVFTCGDISKAEKAFKLFLEMFKPESYRHYVLDRG